MFSRRTETALRLSAGLSLLFLLVAQAKACATLTARPVDERNQPSRTQSPDSKEKQPKPSSTLTFHHVLPAMPDCREAVERAAAGERAAELVAGRAGTAVVSPFGDPSGFHDSPPFLPPVPMWMLLRSGAVADDPPIHQLVSIHPIALRYSIQRIGPPHFLA